MQLLSNIIRELPSQLSVYSACLLIGVSHVVCLLGPSHKCMRCPGYAVARLAQAMLLQVQPRLCSYQGQRPRIGPLHGIHLQTHSFGHGTIVQSFNQEAWYNDHARTGLDRRVALQEPKHRHKHTAHSTHVLVHSKDGSVIQISGYPEIHFNPDEESKFT